MTGYQALSAALNALKVYVAKCSDSPDEQRCIEALRVVLARWKGPKAK